MPSSEMPQPAIQAPLIESAAIELAKDSRLFRKTILREGEINYDGKRIKFTAPYLDGLAAAYRENAYDAVHLTFVDEKNRHNLSPEWVRGQVIGMERTADGIDAIVRASTDQAAQLLRDNPNIGVSARITPDREREDLGKQWPYAIHHVAATTDPRVNQLGPWTPVDLSEDDRPVIDLSSCDLRALDLADDDAPVTPQAGDPGSASAAHDPVPGGTSAADNTTEEAGTVPDTPTEGGGGFSDADIQKLRDMLATFDAQTPAEEPEPEFTEEELRQAAADFLGLTDQPDTDDAEVEETVEEREPATVGLSWEAQRSIDLAQSRADRMEIELAQMRAERDETRFDAEVREFADTYGIDPRITALAKPLMIGRHVVELSSGDEVDAGRVIREVMVEMAKSQRLDLSKTVWDAPDDDARDSAEDDARRAKARDYINATGL